MGFDFSKVQIQEDDNIAEICIFNYIVEELSNILLKLVNDYYVEYYYKNFKSQYSASKTIEFSSKGAQIKIIISTDHIYYDVHPYATIILFISNNYIVNIDTWLDENRIVFYSTDYHLTSVRVNCLYSFLKILKENKLFASIKHIQYPENSIYDFCVEVYTWDYNFLKLYLTYLYPNNFGIKVKNLTIKNVPNCVRKNDIIEMFMNKNKEQEQYVFCDINKNEILLIYENKSI